VFICTDTVDDTKWALKQVDKAKLRRKRIGLTDEELMREVEVMKKLQHENLVKLREVINDPKTNQLYMVQEFCHEGSVMPEAEYTEPLDPEYARELFRDVVKGLEYLHFQRIIHRDMKPSNVFLASPADSNSKIAKIGDFGSSIFLRTDDDMISDVAGSPAFMAPELWVEKPYFSGRAADIWALGATLYNMVVGHPPFMANSEKELIARLENPLDEPIYPREVSPPLR
jgi:[calcium/calmodulin-dependent protein kinase] kinase